MAVIIWFRRDLRLADHAALSAALSAADEVVPLFVLDPRLLAAAAPVRREHLFASLAALDRGVRELGGGGLLVRTGDPRVVVPEVAAQYEARQVLVSGDYAPYGIARDAAVARALGDAGVIMRSADTPYLHPPGQVTKSDGSPFAVFTPYWRGWAALPVPAPDQAPAPRFVTDIVGDAVPTSSAEAGERVAERTLAQFLSGPAGDYDDDRNRPDRPGTSRLGAALHFGEIHPRTVLAAADPAGGFVRQLCWREFYADVLYRRPEVAWHNVDRRFDALPWRDDEESFRDWCEGRTGFPMVDAGMRQLAATGWMHNRVRMVVASFLTKDLMLPWQRGAEWFLRHLVDGDVANNSLGWQWVAGTGMDAAPYYRVFNPVLQGQKFDPAGDFVRQYVPELRHLSGAAVHTPWDQPTGYDHGYPSRIVDHAVARRDALAAYEAIRNP